MEAVNDSSKYVAQARELVKQCLEHEPAEHEATLETVLILLDKTIEVLAKAIT